MFSKIALVNDGHGEKYALDRYRNDKRPLLQLRDIRGEISLENFLNSLSMRLIIGIKAVDIKQKWAQNLILSIDNQRKKIK